MLENKKILILGLARSGYQVAKLLYQNNEIIITDKSDNEKDKIEELEKLNIKFIKSETGEELLEGIDILIKNPGIEPFHPCVKKALELNIPIVNEMEVAYHYLEDNVFIVGITGSNGKTTTTTMLYDLIKLHGLEVTLGGNIGIPLSEVVKDVKANSILVLEISDHQLNDLHEFKTDMSILTNLCPTHLDFHGTYERYINTKKKIFNHHTKDNLAFINYKNEDSLKITKDINSTKIYFNNDVNYFDEKGIYIDKEMLLELKDIKIKGNHNYENITVMLLALKNILKDKFDINIVKDYLKRFNGVEHRIEVVDTNTKIDFYNDSKATNPTSTLIALKTMSKPTRLILGGKERYQDFKEIESELNKVIYIYAIGEVEDRVKEFSEKHNIPCKICHTLENAMHDIKNDVQDGECVLLSPGSASWDQYDKFETRGEEFKKLVEKLFK